MFSAQNKKTRNTKFEIGFNMFIGPPVPIFSGFVRCRWSTTRILPAFGRRSPGLGPLASHKPRGNPVLVVKPRYLSMPVDQPSRQLLLPPRDSEKQKSALGDQNISVPVPPGRPKPSFYRGAGRVGPGGRYRRPPHGWCGVWGGEAVLTVRSGL